MNIKIMLIVNAVIDLLVGVVLVLFPGPATSLLGMQLGPVGQSMMRLFGCTLLSLGLLSYLLRNVKEPSVVFPLVVSLFTGNLVAFILTLVGQIFMWIDPSIVALVESKIGSMPKGGGLFIAIPILLLVMTVGYGYLLMSRRKNSPTRGKKRQPGVK